MKCLQTLLSNTNYSISTLFIFTLLMDPVIVMSIQVLLFKTNYAIQIYSCCCILTFDPVKHAIPKTAEVHIPLAWASLTDKMGQGKMPWYSHRLMHRKRVTCELHDSYFRLMTIKHAIPKIEWAIELLHNSVKTGNQ